MAAEGEGTAVHGKNRRMMTWYSMADDGQTVAFVATDETHPAELYVADVASGRERRLSGFNDEWLGEVALQAAEHFAGRDGPGRRGGLLDRGAGGASRRKQYPVLLNVHGGPFAQWGHMFFDEFQVYAGAGYGVVFCNPRGSSGHDTSFARRRWGSMGGTATTTM
ncbi:MAG: hypothetical protein U5Q44_05275 [Dehalococcoidia bacterium]|nr:hypothetical protein [Dehalococcoidia bacterium]